MNRVSRLSAYARPEAHLSRQTAHGAVVTLLGALLALTLFLHEARHFWRLHRTTKMAVDLERRHELPITLDVVFPAIPCAVLSIDVLDASGTAESDVGHATGMRVHKYRLDSAGKQIGKAEYMTPQSQQAVGGMGGQQVMAINLPAALQHLSDMEDEEGKHEGCRVTGHMTVKRVAGRVRLSVQQNMVFMMLPQLLEGHHLPKVLNISHHVHSLSFGPPFPGQVNPLDQFHRIVKGPIYETFQYHLKIIPTEYYNRNGKATETHQYSVNEYVRTIASTGYELPAVDILYDVSPIVVTVNDQPPSFLHFLVRMCAVVGGVFAVTRLFDRVVDSVFKALKLGGREVLLGR